VDGQRHGVPKACPVLAEVEQQEVLLVVGWLLLERGGCDAGETLVSVEGEGRRGISVLIGRGHGENAGPRPDEELAGVVGGFCISHQYVVGRHGSLSFGCRASTQRGWVGLCSVILNGIAFVLEVSLCQSTEI